ncbi:uncharacterized protein K441DRAFT_657069 [Cenococcum geophilum 1.58]|uniref:uncharacterized protein n=1 Tax=Cenococcum geophilum 1.58 TaxID=794803 RepID=UPI00358E0850|nr:hypothetical protein K441DRAFT_657069 [Cenococcum geophilum 1.58]
MAALLKAEINWVKLMPSAAGHIWGQSSAACKKRNRVLQPLSNQHAPILNALASHSFST